MKYKLTSKAFPGNTNSFKERESGGQNNECSKAILPRPSLLLLRTPSVNEKQATFSLLWKTLRGYKKNYFGAPKALGTERKNACSMRNRIVKKNTWQFSCCRFNTTM